MGYCTKSRGQLAGISGLSKSKLTLAVGIF